MWPCVDGILEIRVLNRVDRVDLSEYSTLSAKNRGFHLIYLDNLVDLYVHCQDRGFGITMIKLMVLSLIPGRPMSGDM